MNAFVKTTCWAVACAIGLAVPVAAHADDLAALKKDVQMGDDAHADEGAKKLAASKDPKAAEVILDLLALGLPPRHAQILLGGLGARHDGKSIEVLGVFAKNRNAEVRRRAVALLAGISDPKVVPFLLAALSDGASEVRAEAAGALGKRKERSAEAKLLQLLERRDAAAPAAVAAIATPDLAHRLGERIGPIPDELLCTTLGEILKRPDFGPDAVRIEIVKTLAKIPGADSTTALQEYLQATEKDPKRPSRKSAQEIIDQRSRS